MKTYNCNNCQKECVVSHQKRNKYCSVLCQKEHEYKTYVTEWKQGTNSGSKGQGELSNHVRRYLFEKYNNTCTGCGLSEWKNQPITLEVEHIDGCGTNNVESNLTLLCPNCHSQTPTYKSKNRGNGRHSRRERYNAGKSY